jgi:diacylglycerol kinase
MKKFLRSMGHATRGILLACREQQNLRIHFVIMVVVVITGIYLGLSAIEWSIIILTIGLVIVAEMINTAIEYMVDLASPDYHRLAKNTKDVAAAAVLMSALIATLVAISIFGNKIFDLLF